MSTDFQIAAPKDPSFEKVVPTASFNNVAPDVTTPQLNNNFNASISFQASANAQPYLTPEPVSQKITYNPDLIQGVDNATMLPQIQPDMSASDSLFGAFCSITEEFTQDIAELSKSVGMGNQVSIGLVNVEPEQTLQQTWARHRQVTI